MIIHLSKNKQYYMHKFLKNDILEVLHDLFVEFDSIINVIVKALKFSTFGKITICNGFDVDNFDHSS